MKKRYEDIASLSVITSSICNLNCKFCYLHKNNAYKEFHKMLAEAWDNGEYVNNIVKSLNALGNDPKKIKQIHFWGGETLIQLDMITKNIPSIYKNFPNLDTWGMSTNWVINVNSFFNFLKEIDKNTNKKTDIEVQISIDGPPGKWSDNGHNGWDSYKKNFLDFLELMNNNKFNFIKVNFHLRSTLPKDLYLETFSKKEEVVYYMNYMANFLKEINEKCISRSVDFRELFTIPAMARPHDFNVEEGKKLCEILYLWEEIAYRDFKDETIPFMFGLNEFNMDGIIFDSNPECGEFADRYTINFDGTIVECSGVFIDYYKPYQEELLKEGNIELYHQALINAENSFNPINATWDEIERWKWKQQLGYRNNSLTYYCLMMGIAKELLASKQIPFYYEDEELLMKHLMTFASSSACSKENFQTTFSPYITSVGNIRKYFNGVVDYGYRHKQKQYYREFKTLKYEPTIRHPEQGENNKYEYEI